MTIESRHEDLTPKPATDIEVAVSEIIRLDDESVHGLTMRLGLFGAAVALTAFGVRQYRNHAGHPNEEQQG